MKDWAEKSARNTRKRGLGVRGAGLGGKTGKAFRRALEENAPGEMTKRRGGLEVRDGRSGGAILADDGCHELGYRFSFGHDFMVSLQFSVFSVQQKRQVTGFRILEFGLGYRDRDWDNSWFGEGMAAKRRKRHKKGEGARSAGYGWGNIFWICTIWFGRGNIGFLPRRTPRTRREI